ncbi:MAG: hypothetical protein Q4C77_03830 [Eubacteriales bacterium]|nr:hypothetical protein [Eubacteriales bacterium]
MKYKKKIRQFLEDNYCMINGLMCPEERKTFGGDVVKIIMDDIDRQIKDEVVDHGRDADNADSE